LTEEDVELTFTAGITVPLFNFRGSDCCAKAVKQQKVLRKEIRIIWFFIIDNGCL
jgi:hypothetical protein